MCLNRSRVNKADRRQWPNTKNAARSPLFVFCFVNQCTLPPLILNPTLLRHAGVSFMPQGFACWASIFWLCCDVLAHFSALQTSDMTVTANGSYPPSPRQRKGWKNKVFNSRLWNAIQSSTCLPGCGPLISSSRMRSCQYNNHRERKPAFSPPLLLLSTPHIFTLYQHRSDGN